jgi:hypothetical protein
MEVRSHLCDGWTRFETPSSVDTCVSVMDGYLWFTNHRGDLFFSHFENNAQVLKVRLRANLHAYH